MVGRCSNPSTLHEPKKAPFSPEEFRCRWLAHCLTGGRVLSHSSCAQRNFSTKDSMSVLLIASTQQNIEGQSPRVPWGWYLHTSLEVSDGLFHRDRFPRRTVPAKTER